MLHFAVTGSADEEFQRALLTYRRAYFKAEEQYLVNYLSGEELTKNEIGELGPNDESVSLISLKTLIVAMPRPFSHFQAVLYLIFRIICRREVKI